MITNTTTDASSSTSTPSMTAPAPKFVSHSNKFNFFPTKVLVTNLTTTSTRMIADSGCSNHYVMLKTPIINKQVATTPIKVLQPNGTSMISTHTCDLPLASLTPTACRGHIIPALTSGALLSLGQLCDDNCHVILKKHTIKIYKGEKLILAGDRDFTTGMWIVNIPHSPIPPLIHPSPRSTTLPPDSESDILRIPFQVEPSVPHLCNSVYEQKTLQDVAKSPVPQTFIDAINAGFFTSWPGLNAALISKHLPKSEATTLGHLDQTR